MPLWRAKKRAHPPAASTTGTPAHRSPPSPSICTPATLCTLALLAACAAVLRHALPQGGAPAAAAAAALPPPPAAAAFAAATAAAAPAPPTPSPPPPSASPRPPLSAEDEAYAAQLRALLREDGDPWDVARAAWEAGHVWPATFVRSSQLFVPPPPAELADTLAPAALAELAASKRHDFCKVMPGNAETAIFKYHQEAEYYAEYAASWKAWTWAKGGVDCNRHLEIVANGVIPIFRGIRSVGATTLFAYPKRLMAFFEDHKEETDVRRLAMMRHFMLHWAHAHLSAPRAVDYMARAADFTAARLGLPPLFAPAASPAPRVAFIDSSLPQSPDYLSMFLLTGLVERFGADAVDVLYPVPYMYPAGPDIDGRGYGLYGLGFGYRHRLARPAAQPALPDMLARLRAGGYAAVVWGSFTRCTAHLHEPETVAAYNHQPHRLWLFDGHDSYSGWPAGGAGAWAHLRLNATVFVREHVVIPL